MKSKIILTLTAIFCSMVVTVVTAYAYFVYSVQTNPIIVQIADYGISITAEAPAVYVTESENTDTENEETESAVTAESGLYTFEEDGTIVFKLTAAGTATTGYCEVAIQNGVLEKEISEDGVTEQELTEESAMQMYCTEQILSGTDYAFSVTASAGTVVQFDAHWGMHTISEGESVQTISDTGAIVLAEITEEKEETESDVVAEQEFDYQ